jgi:hypothetical protein
VDRRPLREPLTPQDEYLHDIATSLRILVDRSVPAPPAEGQISLREPATPSTRIKHVGGGVYTVTVAGVEVDRVKGRDAAEASLREHRDAR